MSRTVVYLSRNGRRQYNELNGADKEGPYSNQRDFTQKFGLDHSL
ncbi:hypothetical protein [Caldicellulosiruptor morganii]|uniref:Uncharacterized protein n=1 Tax=Caldicellulosiruptor morganii TaxID=1387555 RepID=A0ABY7BP47_9FIRM|nr:hypothetical protein [Caldicellulosiruptor morganii]WAM34102.1 hypothetical protein OTK00_000264 [Caldicellulosiruptor morganii]